MMANISLSFEVDTISWGLEKYSILPKITQLARTGQREICALGCFHFATSVHM